MEPRTEPMEVYPSNERARDRFILTRRPSRPDHDPWQYHNVAFEDELTAERAVARTATVFLTSRECPWHCAMCDLWQHTIAGDTPRGAIPAQLSAARREFDRRHESVTHVKLYNAGSFFDPRAVPEADYGPIATCLAGLTHVIVESHPALVGERVDKFQDALSRAAQTATRSQTLEVAVGLETAHPGALRRLHKGMTVDSFAQAARELTRRGVALRTFLLISPPFMEPEEQDPWLLESIDVALSSGASAISLIPTRVGNGTMEVLATSGAFRAPRLEDVERAAHRALGMQQKEQRIFVDLWDLEQLSSCRACFAARLARLRKMNLEQRVLPAYSCHVCDTGAST